jgi:rubredoxin
MTTKICIGCLKALPADHAGELCGLCALGFVPSKSEARDSPAPTSGLGANSETDRRCPYCASALRYRDLNLGSCTVCGGLLDADGGERQTPEQAATPDLLGLRSSSVVVPPRRARGEAAWPEDAPLW